MDGSRDYAPRGFVWQNVGVSSEGKTARLPNNYSVCLPRCKLTIYNRHIAVVYAHINPAVPDNTEQIGATGVFDQQFVDIERQRLLSVA